VIIQLHTISSPTKYAEVVISAMGLLSAYLFCTTKR
jgi:hypothetical protein